MRIVITEDEATLRQGIAAFLRAEGHEVLECEDGLGLLKVLNHDPARRPPLDRPSWPELILLDLRMPLMDGWEVLEFLRQAPRHRRVPVFVLTVLSSREREDLQKYPQVCTVFEKPVDEARLLSEIAVLEKVSRG